MFRPSLHWALSFFLQILFRTPSCPSPYGTIYLTFLGRLSASLKISTLKILNVSNRWKHNILSNCIDIQVLIEEPDGRRTQGVFMYWWLSLVLTLQYDGKLTPWMSVWLEMDRLLMEETPPRGPWKQKVRCFLYFFNSLAFCASKYIQKMLYFGIMEMVLWHSYIILYIILHCHGGKLCLTDIENLHYFNTLYS